MIKKIYQGNLIFFPPLFDDWGLTDIAVNLIPYITFVGGLRLICRNLWGEGGDIKSPLKVKKSLVWTYLFTLGIKAKKIQSYGPWLHKVNPLVGIFGLIAVRPEFCKVLCDKYMSCSL